MIVLLFIVITYKISYRKVLSAKTVGSCCRLEDLVIRHHSEGTSMLNTLHKSLTIAIVLLALFLTSLAAAEQMNTCMQEARFVNLGVKNGLSSIVNYALIQDSRGFIWIGGANGLNRHDVHKIRNFQHDPDRADSLANNRVNVLFEDNRDNLWVGTQNGLDLFDRNKETFQHFKHSSRLLNSLSGNIIQALFEDHSGNIWIGSNGGLDRLAVDEKGVFQISRQSDVIGMSGAGDVHAIAQTPDGKLWIGTDNGLYSWHPESGNRQLFTHNPEQPNSLSHNTISALYVDKTNTLWVGTRGAASIVSSWIRGKLRCSATIRMIPAVSSTIIFQ